MCVSVCLVVGEMVSTLFHLYFYLIFFGKHTPAITATSTTITSTIINELH